MKLCVPIPCFFGDLPFEAAVEKIASLGYRYVEIYGWKQLDLRSAAAALDGAGVTMLSMCTTEFCLTDPARRGLWLDGIAESCEAARALGVKRLISQVGPDTGAGWEAQHRSIVDGLRAGAGVLESAGVTVMIEPLNTKVDHPGYYLTSSSEAFDIVREVGSPNVKIVFDIYHQQVSEGNIIPNVTENLDCIAHLHVAGHPGRQELQSGENDYRNIFAAIDRAGYTGACGLEYSPLTAPEESLAAARALYCGALEKVTVYNKNCEIKSDAIPASVEICGYTGSSAQTYAQACGAQFTSLDNAHTHAFDDGVITVAATCDAQGIKTYTCAVCGFQRKEAIPAAGHKPEPNPGKAATCTEAGLTDGEKCAVCGAILTAQEVIPANGHRFDHKTVAATWTDAGLDYDICVMCGARFNEQILPSLGHTEPDADGRCARCGAQIGDPKTEPSPVTVKPGANAVVIEIKLQIVLGDGSVSDILSLLEHADGAVVKNAAGETLEADAPVGTGTTLTLPDGETYTFCVRGDLDDNGRVTAGDARTVLRASARLETLGDAQFSAANIANREKLTAGDARKILRYSAKLEKEI